MKIELTADELMFIIVTLDDKKNKCLEAKADLEKIDAYVGFVRTGYEYALKMFASLEPKLQAAMKQVRQQGH